MDRRLTPFNGVTALEGLRGQVEAEIFVAGSTDYITSPVIDLLDSQGRRDRQLLAGTRVTVIEVRDGQAFIQSARDNYVGWIDRAALGGAVPTHKVITRATHVYCAADLKSPECVSLPFGAAVKVTEVIDRYAGTEHGFIPVNHLAPLDHRFADPVAVAAMLVGTPYLWGGNSSFGIDCSGLVQLAFEACGIPCPPDSDLQAKEFGHPVDDFAKGDLLFWKGHVAIVADAATIIHANGHDMAVAYEGLQDAIDRIAAHGGGPVTAHRRVSR